ncbi:fasciclin domain-containing protein [Flavobacterium sp. J372]|uniref:fasciclin domain-containing protein n=1 Tax=Flavobacterium sp. J372 TaxID=2898436 RepID=UPI0021511EDE|nr:fasciclin domain-containing protein [Flavobacterium sp. J372]MCR5861033.1 fasciclin domain-containing protein [Flavobacterium sp. J372]
MKKTLLKLSLLLFIAGTSLVSCSDDDNNNNTMPQNSIVDIAASNSNFSILAQAVERAGLTATLDGAGQFTVFAPTNAAFNAYLDTTPYDNINEVPVAALKNLLLNHVIGAEVMSSAVTTGYVNTMSPMGTMANSPMISMYINKSGNTITINGGAANGGTTVINESADIDASNGVIHAVNNVIAIPTIVNHVVANPDFDTLQAVVTSTSGAFGDQSAVLNALNSVTASAPVTVFAPNNAAFTAATTGSGFAVGATPAQVTKVLQYHVSAAGNVRSTQLQNNQSIPTITQPSQNLTVILGGGNVDIRDSANNLSRVFQADVQASNGVIHGVNRVLQPEL